jgi:hypothetical protein
MLMYFIDVITLLDQYLKILLQKLGKQCQMSSTYSIGLCSNLFLGLYLILNLSEIFYKKFYLFFFFIKVDFFIEIDM